MPKSSAISARIELARLVQQNLGEEWPEGYLETVVGGWQGEPLLRPIQPDLEERDPIR